MKRINRITRTIGCLASLFLMLGWTTSLKLEKCSGGCIMIPDNQRSGIVEKTLDGGYAVTTGGRRILPEFTMDESGNLPQDLQIARQRLERREKIVRAWYKTHRPDFLQNYHARVASDTLLAIISIPLFPIYIVGYGCYEYWGIKADYESKHREQWEREERHRTEIFLESRKALKEFIAKDIRGENRTAINAHGIPR